MQSALFKMLQSYPTIEKKAKEINLYLNNIFLFGHGKK